MVLERNDNLIGIDCGASKVLLQSAKINSSRTIISKGQYYKEYVYSSHPDWDPSYRPIPLEIQIKENKNKSILIRKAEKKQGLYFLTDFEELKNKDFFINFER